MKQVKSSPQSGNLYSFKTGGSSGGGLKRRRRRLGSSEQKAESAQILSLSMFIMLLAFFIVLNALSSYEETKVRPAMESLESVFASKISQKDDFKPSVTPSVQYSINEGDTIERLQALFNAQLPSAKTVASQRNGTMHVLLSWEDFKSAVLAAGQEDSFTFEEGKPASEYNFLPTLIALVRSDQLGIPYRMDITLHLNENPAALQNDKPQSLFYNMRDVSSVTQRLEDAGLPTKLMTAGVSKGEAGMAEILFRIHVPFNPLGEGDQLGEETNYE
jgi:hypothetical protein